MTSISAASGGSYQSPLQLLQAELQSEVNSGSISSSDRSALSSALNDINSSLQGGGANGSTGSNAQPSSAAPGDIKSKIDSLIAGEVSSGKLTAQQATELQGVFQNASPVAPMVRAAPDRQMLQLRSPPSARPLRPAGRAARVACTTVITVLAAAIMVVRCRPVPLPPAHRRAAAPAVRRAQAHPRPSCSSSCNRCRARCRTRRRQAMARTAVRRQPATVARRFPRF